MKKLITGAVLTVALVVPASAAAQDPTPSDFKNASKYCKDLKKRSGAANFATLYKNHGKCVSTIAKQTAREDAKQESEAKKNASQQCREERGTTDDSIKAFNEKYGSNKNEQERLRQVRLAEGQGQQGRGRRAGQEGAEGQAERRQAVPYGARHDRGLDQGVQRQVRHQQEQEERLRQVRLAEGERRRRSVHRAAVVVRTRICSGPLPSEARAAEDKGAAGGGPSPFSEPLPLLS